MKEESLEDILEQSRRLAARDKFDSFNKKLWIIIGVSAIIIIPSFPFFLSDSYTPLSERFYMSFMAEFISLPIISAIIALIVSIFPIMGWKFPDRFYRIFLLVFASINGIMAAMCVFNWVFKALGYL
ncbi:MAG: hypothetical protein KDE26_18045 [Bacteroidetes bacterium]|nr:hypothetical protein [Bacteroidota bacterium]